jgi:hypothetical protein
VHVASGKLQLEALGVALADLGGDLLCLLLRHADLAQRGGAKQQRGLERLPDLHIHPCHHQLQRVLAIEGAREQLGVRKLASTQLGDAVRHRSLIDANRDGARRVRTGGVQHVVPSP